MTATGDDPERRFVLADGWLPHLVELWLRLPLAIRVLPPMAVMAVLWWSSSRPPQQVDPSIGRVIVHNSMHVVAFGVLGVACWLAWPRAVRDPRSHRVFGPWLVASLYGVVDELHQAYVPGRVSSWADVFSDVSGAALAVSLMGVLVGEGGPRRRVALFFGFVALVSVSLASFAGW